MRVIKDVLCDGVRLVHILVPGGYMEVRMKTQDLGYIVGELTELLSLI